MVFLNPLEKRRTLWASKWMHCKHSMFLYYIVAIIVKYKVVLIPRYYAAWPQRPLKRGERSRVCTGLMKAQIKEFVKVEEKRREGELGGCKRVIPQTSPSVWDILINGFFMTSPAFSSDRTPWWFSIFLEPKLAPFRNHKWLSFESKQRPFICCPSQLSEDKTGPT